MVKITMKFARTLLRLKVRLESGHLECNWSKRCGHGNSHRWGCPRGGRVVARWVVRAPTQRGTPQPYGLKGGGGEGRGGSCSVTERDIVQYGDNENYATFLPIFFGRQVEERRVETKKKVESFIWGVAYRERNSALTIRLTQTIMLPNPIAVGTYLLVPNPNPGHHKYYLS